MIKNKMLRSTIFLFCLLLLSKGSILFAAGDYCSSLKTNSLTTDMFAAIGKDSLDDTEAIQEALNCLAQKLDKGNNVELHFPMGTYIISKPLIFNQLSENAAYTLSISGFAHNATTLTTNKEIDILKLNIYSLKKLSIRNMSLISEVANPKGRAIHLKESVKNTTTLELKNIIIEGREAGKEKEFYFKDAIFADGFKDTVIKNVAMRGPYVPTDARAFFGFSCIHMINTEGISITSSKCNYMKNGLHITSHSGPIHIKDNHAFGVRVRVAFHIDAGSGDVHISRTHSNSMHRNVEVVRANNVVIEDNLYLTRDDTAELHGGDIYINHVNSAKILNNMFTYPKNFELNPNRTAILVGSNARNVLVKNNLFDEPGTAVKINKGAVKTTLWKNLYLLGSIKKYIDNGLESKIVENLPEPQF